MIPEFVIIEGIVCQSNVKDCDDDLLTVDDVKELHHNSNDLLFDVNHNNQRLSKVMLINNYLNENSDWFVSVLSNNLELNRMIFNRELEGFSLSSSFNDKVCSIDGCVGECEYKDYDIGCWLPTWLSFVDNPCNHLPFTRVEFFNKDGGRIEWI